MKHLLVLFTFISPFTCSYSQQQKELMCDTISVEEADILNKISSYLTIDFDFTLKKVAFYTGSGAGKRVDKNQYFSAINDIKTYNSNAMAPLSKIYILNENEKARADGYDAVIVYGSVKEFPTKKALIRRLHKFSFFR